MGHENLDEEDWQPGGSQHRGLKRSYFLKNPDNINLSAHKFKNHIFDMSLSSNSLIHLTAKKTSLVGILKDHFKLKYCLEKIQLKTGIWTAAIPMVSFCDIPLSQIKNHVERYGNYGIGLKKEWGKKHGLNPVLYLDTNSQLGADLREASKELLLGKRILGDLRLVESTVLDILRFSKNYQHTLQRSGSESQDYRFSDEREWRYVPERKDAPPVVLASKYSTPEQKKQINHVLKNLRLEFDPDDINYIIIREDTEITEFLRIIKELGHTPEQVDRLYTRIITTKQIETDF